MEYKVRELLNGKMRKGRRGREEWRVCMCVYSTIPKHNKVERKSEEIQKKVRKGKRIPQKEAN